MALNCMVFNGVDGLLRVGESRPSFIDQLNLRLEFLIFH